MLRQKLRNASLEETAGKLRQTNLLELFVRMTRRYNYFYLRHGAILAFKGYHVHVELPKLTMDDPSSDDMPQRKLHY